MHDDYVLHEHHVRHHHEGWLPRRLRCLHQPAAAHAAHGAALAALPSGSAHTPAVAIAAATAVAAAAATVTAAATALATAAQALATATHAATTAGSVRGHLLDGEYQHLLVHDDSVLHERNVRHHHEGWLPRRVRCLHRPAALAAAAAATAGSVRGHLLGGER